VSGQLDAQVVLSLGKEPHAPTGYKTGVGARVGLDAVSLQRLDTKSSIPTPSYYTDWATPALTRV